MGLGPKKGKMNVIMLRIGRGKTVGCWKRLSMNTRSYALGLSERFLSSLFRSPNQKDLLLQDISDRFRITIDVGSYLGAPV